MSIPAAPGFRSRLLRAINDCRTGPLPEALITYLLDLGEALHRTPLEKLTIPFPQRPPADLEEEDQDKWEELTLLWQLEATRLKDATPPILENVIIESLTAYVRHWPGGEDGPFSLTYAEGVDFPTVCYEMTALLRDQHLKEVGAFDDLREAFQSNLKAVTARQLKGKPGELIYPQDYRGPQSAIADAYFAGTPFLQLFKARVPFPLYDKTRFEHHHVLGKRGTGKSTLLSHLIDHDIKRVPAVSVVVIDSQHRMIDGFAHLPGIDPIVIGPRNPIALNPFKWGNTDDVVEILTYAFGSIFEAGLTQLQSGPVEYIIRAVAQDPNANLDSLVDFVLQPKQDLIDKTDQNCQTYFNNFYKKMPANTKSGIVQKIMGFRKHTTIDAMLNADGNDLDLPMELQNGRIILVDTNKDDLTGDQTYVFGRLFIALLHNTMRKRIKADEHTIKPTFVYIDELADYCPAEHDDKIFRELLDQSRKQKMGFIVAHQRADQINTRVLKSLEDSALITQCLTKGTASISVYGKEALVTVPPFKFSGRVEREAKPLVAPHKPEPPELPDVV